MTTAPPTGEADATLAGELAGLLDAISDGVYRVDRDWRLTYINRTAADYFGAPARALVGRTLWEAVPAGVGTVFEAELRRAAAGRDAVRFTAPSLARAGRWVELRVHPGERGLTVYFLDVTERVQAEQATRTREEQLRRITDTVPVMISYIDLDMRYRLVNHAYERWYERPREEVVGRRMADVLGAAAWEVVGPKVARALAGEAVTYEAEAPSRTGGSRWIRATYTPDRDAEGRVCGIVALVADITERRQMEEQVRRSEATLRSLLDNTPSMMGVVELPPDSSDVLHVLDNACAERFFGAAPGATAGRWARGELGASAETVRRWSAAYREAQRTGRPVRFASGLDAAEPAGAPTEADAARLWLDVSVSAMGPGADGRDRFCYTALDDTERRRAEEALRASEERLRRAQEAARLGTWDWDIERDTIVWSDGVHRLLGLRPGELDPGLGRWLEYVLPEDVEPTQQAVAQVLARGGEFSFEFRVRRSDGAVRWLASIGHVEPGPDGRARRMLGVNIDISDRKAAEEALRVSEERLRMALTASRTYAWTRDLQTGMTTCSENVVEVVGLSASYHDSSAWQALHPDDVAGVRAAYERAASEGGAFVHDFRVVRPDTGEVVWLQGSGRVQRDASGRPLRIVGTSTDITARKRVEREMAALIQRLVSLVDNSPLLVIEWDAEFAVTRWSGQAERLFGWTAAEVVGARIDALRFVVEDDLPRFMAAMLRLRDPANRFVVCDSRNYTKTGGVVECEWYCSVLHDERGATVAVLSLGLDVTERNRAAREREQLTATLDSFVSSAPVGLAFVDAAFRYVRINESLAAVNGLPAAAHVGLSVAEVVPTIWPALEPVYRQVLATGEAVIGLEFTGESFHRPDGVHTVVANFFPVRLADGGPIGVGIATLDITARKQAEDALRRAEGRLRLALSAARLGDWDWDAKDDFVTFSARAAEIFGVPAGRVMTWTTMLGLLHPEDRERTAQAVEKAVAERSDYRAEYRVLRPDGAEVWVCATGRVRVHAAGATIGLIGVVEDITERRRAEREAAELAQRLTTLVDNTPLGVIEWDAEFVVTRWSGQAERLFGWTAEEVVGRRIDALAFVHEEDLPRVAASMERLCDPANRFVVIRNRNYTQSGAVVECEWYNSVLHDERGGTVALLSLVLDVTERARAEQALRRSEERLRRQFAELEAIYSSAPLGLCVLDTELRYRRVNDRFAELGGLPAAAHIGRSMQEVAPGRAGQAEAAARRVLESGRELRAEFRGETPSAPGSSRIWDEVWYPLRDADGRIYGIGVVADEVTERRRTEEALQEADRRKDQFLATLAHELRNPLAPISNALQVWPLVEKDAPAAARVREMMGRQVRQLTRLIDDLLDVSRITRGKIELRRERIELAAVIEGALEGVRPFVESRAHALVVTLPAEPVTLDGDPGRLIQVFGNLVHNAAKYTGRDGHIWITAAREGGAAEVRVRDDGPGIPRDKLTEIFEMFAQVDQTLDRAHGGLGIGLTLVKTLVEMHGGTVEARSEGPGRGAEFVVRLPVATATATAVVAGGTSAATGPLPRRRVLVVDDIRPSASTLALMLQGLGQETRATHDGASALAEVERFRPQVVISDIAMPGMDGYELARRVRKLPAPQPVLVALTGYGQEEDRRRAREAGFDHHLVKPVSVEALHELLAASAGGPGDG